MRRASSAETGCETAPSMVEGGVSCCLPGRPWMSEVEESRFKEAVSSAAQSEWSVKTMSQAGHAHRQHTHSQSSK